MFHLVEFVINGTVAVVPHNWLSDGFCFWPTCMRADRVNRAVRNAEEPGSDWQTYDARSIRSYDNYLEARRWLKKSLSCATSDLQSEEEEDAVPIKRKIMTVHFFEENPPQKKARGPTTSGTVAPSPPLPLTPSPPQLDSGRPAGARTPSRSQGHRPTWRGERCGSDTLTYCAALPQLMSLMQNLQREIAQLHQKIDKLTYLASKKYTN